MSEKGAVATLVATAPTSQRSPSARNKSFAQASFLYNYPLILHSQEICHKLAFGGVLLLK